jgi:hypothetical protein
MWLVRSWVVALALNLLVAILLCSLVFDNQWFTPEWTNADTLVLTSFVWDVRNHDYAWSGFHLPRIPSLFPDLTFYSLLDQLLGDYRWAIFGYAVAQFLGFIFAGGWLIRLATEVPFRKSVGVLALLSTLVILVNLHFSPLVRYFDVFLLVMHFGAFLMSLVAIGLTVLLIEKWKSYCAVLLVLCCFIAFLSDKIFAFDFALPLAASLLISIWLRLTSGWRAMAILSIVAVGLSCATFVDGYLVREVDLPVEDVVSHAAQFIKQTPRYLLAVPVAATVSLLLPLAISLATPLLVIRQRMIQAKLASAWSLMDFAEQGSAFRALTFLWIFMVFAMAATLILGAAIFVSAPPSYRYITVILFWPIIFSAIVTLRYTRIELIPSAGTLLLTILMMAITTPHSLGARVFAFWRHPLGMCILENSEAFGLRAGLSAYWFSRPVTISTDWTVQVDQIDFAGMPFVWENDPFWYVRSFSAPWRSPEYNFIITDELDINAIRNRFGEPDRIERCDRWTIWIYHDAGAVWHNLVRGYETPRPLMRPGISVLKPGLP